MGMEDGTRMSPGHIRDTRTCEVRDVLDRVGDKWSLLLIELLDHDTRRFSELKREIDGISQRMLTRTLRQLERDGLVTRTVHAVVPPRVEYALTPLGHTLFDAIQPLVTWSRANRAAVARSRDAFDATAPLEAAGP